MVRLLTGAFALVAAAAPPGFDPVEIAERTRAFQQAATAYHRGATPLGVDAALAQRLARAEAKADAQPAEGAEEVEAALAELAHARSLAALHLDAVERSLQGSPHQATLSARLATQRAQLELRMGDATARLTTIAARLAPADGLGEQALRAVARLNGTDPHSALQRFRLELLPGLKAPILGSDLTYVQTPLVPLPLGNGQLVPAYLAAGVVGLNLEDTTHDREVEASAELTQKAQALGGAAAAWDFVKNDVALDWYYGALKGSTETLRELRGNDADKAALLVALLRAQGTPARFVRGTVELPVGKLADLLGLLGAAEAAALDARGPTAPPFVLPAATRDRALQALSASGTPFAPLTSGGQVAAVRLSHVWVEAYLGYADYRGTGASAEGKQWVPLDAAISGTARHAATPAVVDALAAMGTTGADLAAGYLNSATAPSPLEHYRAQVQAWLGAHQPGVNYPQTLRTVEPRFERLPLIPGSLPFRVVSVEEESAFLPDAFKHRVRVRVSDAAGALLEVTLPLHRLVGHRAALSYAPATAADAAALLLGGGPYQAAASIIEVVPQLRLDGVAAALGTRAVGLGAENAVSFELLLPDGTSRRVENRLIAGNVVALGFGGPKNAYAEPATQPAADLDGPAVKFLFGRATAYVNAWTDAEEELARLTQVVLVRPTASVVFVENQLDVDTVLGVRKQVRWKGLEVDADLRTVVPIELVPGRAAQLLELSGYQGSFLEAQVLAQGTHEEAVSATEVLRAARRQGAPVLTLTPANQAALLPTLVASAEVLRDVADLLALGREVLIPQQPLTFRDWTGTGYIARNPVSREAGYFLSGVLSGGQTVVSPQFWTDQALLKELRDNPPHAIDDLAQVARILQMPTGGAPNSFQKGVVGKRLALPVAVLVTTLDGVPVAGAPVTFKPLSSGASPTFQPANAPTPAATPTLSTTTNTSGVAFAWVLPDTTVLHRGMFDYAGAVPQLIGLNEVTAETSNGTTTIGLADPFRLVGLPDALARLSMRDDLEGKTVADGLETGFRFTATAVDQWGNFLANQSVAWTQWTCAGQLFPCVVTGAATGAFVAPGADHVRVRDPSDLAQLPTVVHPSDTVGDTETGWVSGYVSGVTPERVQLKAAVGGVFGANELRVEPAGVDRFILRTVTPALAASGGLQGTSLPVPEVAQVLRRSSASGWTAVRGDEAALRLKQVVVTFQTRDSDGGLVETTSINPALVGPDGGTDAVHWPKYRLEDELQAMTTSAQVVQRNAQGEEVIVCCTDTWTLGAFSGTPHPSVRRRLQGGLEVDAPAGQAFVDDTHAGFSISNPASHPIYFRLSEQPQDPSEALLADNPLILRHPDDATLLAVPPLLRTTFLFPVMPGTAGGKVTLRVWAPEANALPGTLIEVGAPTVLTLQPANTALAAADPRPARIILPVRNFESAATPPPGQTSPPQATEPPVLEYTWLHLSVAASGEVKVTDPGGAVLGVAEVVAGATGVLSATASLGSVGVDAKTRQLLVGIRPGDPAGEQLTVTLKRAGLPDELQQAQLATEVDDLGALPIGHTFVKDVSVVDGHLMKQAEDLRVPGRGPPLSLQRSYTNRGHEEGALGKGWTHSLQAYALEGPDLSVLNPNGLKVAIVGGDGSGQVFSCGPGLTACKTQVGFHGTLHGEDVPTGGKGEDGGTTGEDGGVFTERNLVLRTRGGVRYRYAAPADLPGATRRYTLKEVTDPSGNTLSLEYGPARIDGAVVRVYEAGNARYLQLQYGPEAGASRARLQSVRLMQNPLQPSKLPPGADGTPLQVCIAYGYTNGNLTRVERFDGECGASAPVRAEAFTYVDGGAPHTANNLSSHTDPNGNTTRFRYFSRTDTLPGEAGFVRFAADDKEERVKAVEEPLGATTTFGFSLVSTTAPPTYVTTVQGPRPGVPATTYRLEPYGTASKVVRPLDAAAEASSSAVWDRTHLRVTEETDPRGRVTRLKYDDFGNLTEKRTATAALPAQGAAPATLGVVDATGAPVAEVVEKWSYEPAFNQPVCHLDAEGRLTEHTIDSNGADPRTGAPAGTGLRLTSTLHATPAASAEVASNKSCAEVALTVPPSPDDVTTRTRYCGVAGVNCNAVPGAVKGDVKETEDGEGRVTQVLAYDGFGNAEQTAKGSGLPAAIVTTSTFDGRSRLKAQTDTFGHDSAWDYDALDRPTLVTRKNTRAAPPLLASPAMTQRLTYYPGGQVKTDTNGLTLTRTTALDALNRPSTVTEEGGGLPAPLQTTHVWDEAGNEVATVDRRGARTTRTFDYADRLVETKVAADPVRPFDGEVTVVGVAGVTAKFGYDAAGNKVFEEDLHGHRTDFTHDALYRVVAAKSPPVPGATASAGALQYTTERRFDLLGNTVREADGNGHAAERGYDFANRLIRTLDPVGREERRTYDKANNLRTVTKRAGGVDQLVRTTTYDGLNRPLTVTEAVKRAAGLTPAVFNYTQSSSYEDAAHRVSSRDRRGFVTTRTLDDLDRVIAEVSDATSALRTPDDARAGSALNLTVRTGYDANGNAVLSRDALGRETTTTFDGLNRPTAKALPMGVTESFSYDGEGHVTSHTDGRGITRTARFDLLGRPTKQFLVESVSNAGASLQTAEVAYFDAADGDGLTLRSEANALGNVTRHREDGLHREVETIDAQFHSSFSRFDATVRRESVDRRGYLTRYSFDAADRPTGAADFEAGATATSAATYSQSTAYDDTARTVTSLDRRGIASVQHQDGLGRTEKTTRGTAPLEQVTLSALNGAGAATKVTDPNGHVTESVFDGAGRLVETTRGFGTADAAKTTFTFDAVGNRLETKSARVTGVSYDVRESFDDLNRAVRSEDALGNVTSRAFDAAGNKLCEKRPLGGAVFAHGGAAGMTVAQLQAAVCTGAQLTRWSYDETGALLSTADALGGVWTYLYDLNRNLVSKQDANLQLTTYAFDSLDRRTRERQHLDAHARVLTRATVPTDAAAADLALQTGTLTWSRTYDSASNVLTTTDAKGQVATNVWGILNRLTSTDYTHVGTRALPSLDGIDYGFDENGNLTDATERKTTSTGATAETTLRTFDALDRLKTELRYDGKLVSYEYDLKGNRTQVLDSSSVATDYTFDALDRLLCAYLNCKDSDVGYILKRAKEIGSENGEKFGDFVSSRPIYKKSANALHTVEAVIEEGKEAIGATVGDKIADATYTPGAVTGSKVSETLGDLGKRGTKTGLDIAEEVVKSKAVQVGVTVFLGGVAVVLGKGAKVADPWTLKRTHEIGGTQSSKQVLEMAEAMKSSGYSGPPIEVVVHDGKMFIVDGHHRLAAAKMAGLKEVPVKVIDDIAKHPSSWRTVEEVVNDAAAVGPNTLRKKGKLLPY